MSVRAIIPFKPKNPKTRLSKVMSQEERENFAEMMLGDVVDAVVEGGCTPTILSTAPYCLTGIETIVHAGGLNEALNAILPKAEGPTLIVMSDLPLITPANVEELLATKARMAMVPGRGGGTNAIFLHAPSGFRADFYGASFLKHLEIAGELGLSVEIIDSFRLHDDIDEVWDLVEILTLGSGGSRRYLERLGFTISVESGRVGVKRDPHE
ncbi:MAG: 2-phospho-L-lactate guanylyltransferase [Methanomicrobiales archaeon]|nr:2-phospho-L-lactate guanylyltransferase [Methanomicrobiales archaeon]MDD1668901.1 2-phospho-L-lactate guanylyltransferase [Methanomicrobiales archaeon]